MKMNKKNLSVSTTDTTAGITLIALVVTIIILVILAAVSIRLILGENSIIRKGEDARDQYINAQEHEKEQTNELTQTIIEETKKHKAYTIGEEVTVKGEQFFVIENSNENNSKVKLLAKYNLNQDGTEQANLTNSETQASFSGSDYWNFIFPDDGNLNDVPGYGETDAIGKAKAYGRAKGGIGRLLTKPEALSLYEIDSGIVDGSSYDAVDGYLNYWLGTKELTNGSYRSYKVFYWFGRGTNKTPVDFLYYPKGVRPVIEILKSNIS